MRRTILALVCAALLGMCGCAANGVAVDGVQTSPEVQSLDMTDHQRASDEPPNVHEVSYGCASIKVPRDWEILDDPELNSIIVYAPYHASASVLGSDDVDIDPESLAQGQRDLLYEVERDGERVVRDEFLTDGDTIRMSTVYVHEDDEGTTYQYWDNSIYSGGRRADFFGSIDESCTDAQKAEFAWVADSLRLDASS